MPSWTLEGKFHADNHGEYNETFISDILCWDCWDLSSMHDLVKAFSQIQLKYKEIKK